MKSGLVLEGGGAKGAFSAGVLSALNDISHSKFDYVSGTSIGAIHALFYSVGAVGELKQLWDTISIKKVWDVRLISPLVIISILLLSLRIMLVQNSDQGRETSKFMALIISGMGIVLFFFKIISDPNFFFNDIYDLFFLLFLMSYYPLFLLFIKIPSFNISIFKTDPLRRILEKLLLECGKPKIPTYVTIAVKKEIFDPDNPAGYAMSAKPPVIKWNPEEQYIPKYIRIDKLSKEEIIDAVIASSSLPAFIVKSHYVKSELAVDGGVVDNTPIFPILKNHKCNQITIISLSNDALSSNSLKEKVNHILRLKNLEKYSLDYFESFTKKHGTLLKGRMRHQYNAKNSITLKDFDQISWPKFIKIFQPKTKMGGLLTGTLNFSRKKADRLFSQGYKNAKHIILKVNI